jgi:hypothetical protein
MSLSVDFNGWQVRQNVGGSLLSQLVADKFGGDRLGDELSQDYDFSGPFMGDPNLTANLQINCRIEKGMHGLSVNTMLFFYLRPFHLTEETSLIMRLYTEDRTRGGQVPVIARPFGGFQEKGSDWVVLAVIGGSEETQKCVSALTSGQQLNFMLFKEKQFADDAKRKSFEGFCDGVGYYFSDQLVKLPLPPDAVFKEVYDESYQRIAGAEDAMPQDRKYLELARTFAIVIISPNYDDDAAHAVWLVSLDEKGDIDLGPEEFVLAKTTTRNAALNYAMKLSNLLKLRVLEIAKT